MKLGDVVYFKRAKDGTKRKTELEFKGHGFGVFLGSVPPFAPEPQAWNMITLMGRMGFLSFDDVGELLGPEMGKLAIEKFQEKYYPKEIMDKMEEIAKKQQSSLIDIKGQSIQQETSNEERG